MKLMITDSGAEDDAPIIWYLDGVRTCRRAWKTLHSMGLLSLSAYYNFFRMEV